LEKKETKQATERLLRLDQVLVRVPISRATWYAGIRDGRFPPPVKLGARISAWRERDVLVLLDRGIV
jgi:prophage regulatory protein